MNCDCARQILLEHDLGPAERTSVASAISHLESCETCRGAVGDYDRIREALKTPESPTEPPGGWADFEERLASTAARSPALPSSRAHLLPAALAACLVVAITGLSLYIWKGNLTHPARSTDNSSTLLVARPTEQEISERAQLFEEVSQVFEHRANWVLVADGGSDVGVSSHRAANGKNLLLVRLNVSRDGLPFSTADLMVLPGEAARTTVRAGDRLRLKYEVITSQADSGRLQIATEVLGADQPGLRFGAIAGEVVIRMGQIASVGQVVTAQGVFEVNVGLYRADSPGRRS